MTSDSGEPHEHGDQDHGSEERDLRAIYEAPRLICHGSFQELTKGGGLTGQDIGVPFGARPG